MAKIGLFSAGVSVAGALALWSASASAAPVVEVGVENAAVLSGITTIAGPSSPAAGVFDYSNAGVIGNFTINSASGTLGTSPLLSGDTNTTVDASGAGTLDLFITETGLTSPLGQPLNFASGLTSNFIDSDLTVEELTYVNSNDAAYGTSTLLADHVFSPDGNNAQLVNVQTNANTGTGPYSLTEEFVITATGAGNTNDTIDISAAAPEPAAWSMMLIGLFGIGAVLRTTRSQRAASLA